LIAYTVKVVPIFGGVTQFRMYSPPGVPPPLPREVHGGDGVTHWHKGPVVVKLWTVKGAPITAQ
jgi:hypothetical protein